MKRRCAVGAGGVGLTAEVALHGRIGIGIGRHKSPGRARPPALLCPAVEAWARWHWPAAACGLACTPCRAVARLRRCGNGRATTDSPPPELCSEICAASEAGFQSWARRARNPLLLEAKDDPEREVASRDQISQTVSLLLYCDFSWLFG